MSKSSRSKWDFKRKSILNDARNSAVNTSVLNKHWNIQQASCSWDDIFGLISCVTFALFEKVSPDPVKILCIYTLKLQTFLCSKFSRRPLKLHAARLKFYLPSYVRGSIPGRCPLFSYKNTEAWGNRCSPSLRKHQASSFVWTRITFQQLPLLNVTACLHTKAPLWWDHSLSRRTWWPQAVQLRVLAGCGARLCAADVTKIDCVWMKEWKRRGLPLWV